jgi:hypothetical protein
VRETILRWRVCECRRRGKRRLKAVCCVNACVNDDPGRAACSHVSSQAPPN